jgi:hypothetical protein
VLLLAGCGLPRPFETTEKSLAAPGLLKPDAGLSVLVVPVAGLPDDSARDLAEAAAQALRKRDIVASTRAAHAGGLLLQGRAEGADAGVGRLTWRLSDSHGLVLGEVSQQERFAGRRAANLADMAERAAARLEPLLLPESARPQSLSVAGIAGASPRTQQLLLPALHEALGRRGFTVAMPDETATAPPSLSVAGRLRQEPRGMDKRYVEIVWSVADANGTTLGEIRQGDVVAGSGTELTDPALLRAIADGGAEGVAALLRAKRQTGGG